MGRRRVKQGDGTPFGRYYWKHDTTGHRPKFDDPHIQRGMDVAAKLMKEKSSYSLVANDT